MKTLLLAILIIAVSVILLGVKVFFVKNGKFPAGHIGGNAEMRRRGIDCAAHTTKQNKTNRLL